MIDQTNPIPFLNYYYILFVIWGIFATYYILRVYRTKKPRSVLIDVYDTIPTIFTTLGVLGTFIGIYFALQSFDANNIDKSIFILLNGLKTAFGTSIVGIVLSIVFGKISRIVMERAMRASDPLDEVENLTPEAILLDNILAKLDQNNKLLARLAERDEVTSSTVVVLKKNSSTPNYSNSSNKQVETADLAIANNLDVSTTSTAIATTQQGFNDKVDFDLAEGKYVVDKLETNLATAVQQTTDVRETTKLKQAILRGLDPSLAVEKMSQVVVVDNAKEKLAAYNAMRDQLVRLVEVQKDFFKTVATDIQQELNGFSQEITKLSAKVEAGLNREVGLIQDNLNTYTVKLQDNFNQTTENLTQSFNQASTHLKENFDASAIALKDTFAQSATNLTDNMAQSSHSVIQQLMTEVATVNQNFQAQTQKLTQEFVHNAAQAVASVNQASATASSEHQQVMQEVRDHASQAYQQVADVSQSFGQQINFTNHQANYRSQEVQQSVSHLIDNLNNQYQQLNNKVDAMGVAIMDLLQHTTLDDSRS